MGQKAFVGGIETKEDVVRKYEDVVMKLDVREVDEGGAACPYFVITKNYMGTSKNCFG